MVINEALAAITSDDELRKVIAGFTTQDIYNIFDAASKWVLVFGIVAAIIAFMAAGFNFLTSHGDAQKLESAKKLFFYAVIGTVVIVLSRALVLGIGAFFN